MGQPHLCQRQPEFGGRRRLHAALAEPLPQRGEEGREEDDVDRVDRLEDRRGNRPAFDIAVGEQVHRPARLFEQAPEQRIERDQEERSEEHTSEFQSLMRKSYDVCCLKKKTLYTTK